MQIDDRGLGDVVYHLMMGQGDPQFFPGLNVLVNNEDLPGGLWAELRNQEMRLHQWFRDNCSSTEELCMFMVASYDREDVQRQLCLKMFRYGLLFAPLLQRANPEDGDEEKRWNQFWGGTHGLTPDEEAEMSKQLAKDVNGIAELFNDPPQKNKKAEETPDVL